MLTPALPAIPAIIGASSIGVTIIVPPIVVGLKEGAIILAVFALKVIVLPDCQSAAWLDHKTTCVGEPTIQGDICSIIVNISFGVSLLFVIPFLMDSEMEMNLRMEL